MKYVNNPFNIRYNPRNQWKGQVDPKNGFCQFFSLYYGIRAAAYTVMVSYRSKGIMSYAPIISRWAPSTENNTSAYISYVLPKGHSSLDVLSTKFDYVRLLTKMSEMEGNPIQPHVISRVIDLYKLDKKL